MDFYNVIEKFTMQQLGKNADKNTTYPAFFSQCHLRLTQTENIKELLIYSALRYEKAFYVHIIHYI